jgi:hypothetical protein
MTDEQIVQAAKTLDTPHGKISLIHTRDDGQEVPTLMARQFADALPAKFVEIETTPVVIDLDSKAGQMAVAITKALHDAGAPMCDETRRVMSKVEKITWLGKRIAELEAENARLLMANRDCIDHFNGLKADYDALLAAPSAPVAVFDGYIDGTAVIQWRGQGLPAGTLLYAAPVAAPAGGYCVESYNCVCGGDTASVRATCDNWRK